MTKHEKSKPRGEVEGNVILMHTTLNASAYFSVHHRNTSKRGETFGISRIGSKIKGVFKSTTMEGAILPPSAMNDFDEDLVSVSFSRL